MPFFLRKRQCKYYRRFHYNAFPRYIGRGKTALTTYHSSVSYSEPLVIIMGVSVGTYALTLKLTRITYHLSAL